MNNDQAGGNLILTPSSTLKMKICYIDRRVDGCTDRQINRKKQDRKTERQKDRKKEGKKEKRKGKEEREREREIFPQEEDRIEELNMLDLLMINTDKELSFYDQIQRQTDKQQRQK